MARVITKADLQSVTRHFKLLGSLVKKPDGPPGIEKCESEIERRFFMASYDRLKKLGSYVPQYQFGSYRLDFALITSRRTIAIEADGHDYHSTKEQKAHDTKRDRYLLAEGVIVIRFTGSEIYASVDSCIEEVLQICQKFT